jgi:hypothetical protein
MTVLKQYNTGTSTWETVVVGQPGEAGIVNGTVAPTDTSVLWLDTADAASQVAIPSGGTAGQVLAKTSGTDYATGWSDNTGTHNAIINGGFDIWQRGTSFSVGTNFIYAADRWMANRGALAAGMSVSRQAVNDATNLPNIRYAMRMQRDSGNTNTNLLGIATTLETADSIQFIGKTIAFSYYVRAGSNYSGGNFTAYLAYGTGIDQNVNYGFTGQTVIITASAALTSGSSGWQRVTGTATVPTNATQIGLYAMYVPTGTAGANDYVDVTGFQLELGSVATPFKRNAPSIQGELAACQRYFVRFGGDYPYQFYGYATAQSSTTAVAFMPLPVSMRIAPSAIGYSTVAWQQNGAGGVNAISSLTLGTTYLSRNVGVASMTGTSMTSGQPIWLIANASTSSYVEFSAEL